MSDVMYSTLDVTNHSFEAAYAKRQEIKNLSATVDFESKKHFKYRIIKDAVLKCLTKNEFPSELCAKINKIIQVGEVAQCLKIHLNDFNDGCGRLLNLTNLDKVEDLNYEEGCKLVQAVERTIIRKSASISRDLKEITGTEVEDILNSSHRSDQIAVEDRMLVEYKLKLNCQQDLYIKNLLEQANILDQILQMRLQTLPKIVERKISECAVKSSMYHLRSQIVREKLRVDVFEETSTSLAAYSEIQQDISRQQSECKGAIVNLRELKEKYNVVASKEYDEILKSYLKYKSAVEDRKKLLNTIK